MKQQECNCDGYSWHKQRTYKILHTWSNKLGFYAHLAMLMGHTSVNNNYCYRTIQAKILKSERRQMNVMRAVIKPGWWKSMIFFKWLDLLKNLIQFSNLCFPPKSPVILDTNKYKPHVFGCQQWHRFHQQQCWIILGF